MSPSLLTVIESLGESIYRHLLLEKILVTVRHPSTLEIAQFERNRNTPNLRPSQRYAMVSESIRVRGSRTPIGQIEIHSSGSKLRADELLAISLEIQERIQQAIESASSI